MIERSEIMTVNQIRDYTALVRRKSELILQSGSSWKAEYSAEMQNIDEQIRKMRKELIKWVSRYTQQKIFQRFSECLRACLLYTSISADELTERFIRGDVSRSTEGSGLGLSIAKNLTELQGGKFELYLDGDLFKVTIVFPKAVVGQSVTKS